MMRVRFPRSLAVALAGTLFVLLLPFPATAQSPPSATALSPLAVSVLRAAEWKAIETVIREQLTAMQAGDSAKAFAQAAPAIQQQFGTPENFLAMVRTAYGALIAARYTEFLEGAVVEGNVIQPLRLIAPDNTVQVALYTMQKQSDGHWKIVGCLLAPSTVQAA
jgi:hypothetical protein